MTMDMQSHADADLFPYRTKCATCEGSFRFMILDRMYCSYECAGVTVPDAQTHPPSCWTWDDKPKMGFSTPDAAWCMCVIMNVAGSKPYYCALHHFWHVGYSDGTEDADTTKE